MSHSSRSFAKPSKKATFTAGRVISSGMHFAAAAEKKSCAWAHVNQNRATK
jgi:hypothetical protein